LIRDEKTILIESGFPVETPILVSGLEKLSLTPKDIDFLALTHVHIDHAGGAGNLAQANPHLKIFVHAMGSKHLINPAKLTDSVKRAYGKKFSVVGAMAAISSEMIRPVNTGDTIDLGNTQLEVYYTPGTSESVFSGDALGSKYKNLPNFVLSPPADYNKELAKKSIDLIKDLKPKRINFTHCGAYDLDRDDDFYENLKAKHDRWNHCILEIVKENQQLSSDVVFKKFLEKIPELKNYPSQFFSFNLSVNGILLYLKKSGRL